MHVDLRNQRRILVIRPDEIGDVVLTGPLLRALRKWSAPTAHITLLVKRDCHDLVALCPYVDEVVALNFKPNPTRRERLRLYASAFILRWLKFFGRRFDIALLPRRDPDWYCSEKVAALLVGAGRVIAHEEKVILNSTSVPEHRVSSTRFSNPHVQHEVEHNLHILSDEAAPDSPPRSTALELWLSPEDHRYADDWISNPSLSGRPLVVIHPSGGHSILKQWPIDNYVALVRESLIPLGAAILIVGGPDEAWIVSAFDGFAGHQIHIEVGTFSLRQLGAIIGKSCLFIGGDTGVTHIAAASGAPVLAIFGPTSEIRFAPFAANAQVISLRYDCSPDKLRTFKDRCVECIYHSPRCMTELPVEAVAVQAIRMIGRHLKPHPTRAL